jgi:hypothetical protein
MRPGPRHGVHAHKLLLLHAWINTESIAITSPDCETRHTGGFDSHCSIAEQQQDTKAICEVSGACLASVLQMANNMANSAVKSRRVHNPDSAPL